MGILTSYGGKKKKKTFTRCPPLETLGGISHLALGSGAVMCTQHPIHRSHHLNRRAVGLNTVHQSFLLKPHPLCGWDCPLCAFFF